MTLSLTPEIEQFIDSQIASGRYTTVEEMILAALRLLQTHETIYQGRLEELRQDVLIRVAEADRGDLIDGETVFRQLQDRLEQRRAQAQESSCIGLHPRLVAILSTSWTTWQRGVALTQRSNF